jgi:hypothetical protein
MIDADRLRMLEAMGIDVYALRGRASEPQPEREPAGIAVDADGVPASSRPPTLVVVCAAGMRADARLAHLSKRLPQTFGISPGAIDWFEADAGGSLPTVSDAPAYLVFGTAVARSLGAQLSTMQQSTAVIAVIADPAQLIGGAADKRALWGVLKPIARRLRGALE